MTDIHDPWQSMGMSKPLPFSQHVANMRVLLLTWLLAAVSTFPYACAQGASQGASKDDDTIFAPAAGEGVRVGENYTIGWSNIPGSTVAITLMTAFGTPTQYSYLQSLASGVANNGAYIWSVPSFVLVPNANIDKRGIFYLAQEGPYSIMIDGDGDPHYSGVFVIFEYAQGSTSATETLLPTSSTSSAALSSTPPISVTDSPTSSTATASSSSNSIATTISGPSPSLTITASSSLSSSPTSTSATGSPIGPPKDIIIGSVIGGLALLVIGALIGLWIIVRARRKRAIFQGEMLKPPSPPDPNNQSIWEGKPVSSFNPRKHTSNIYGGQDMSSQGIGDNFELLTIPSLPPERLGGSDFEPFH
ncbi:hypothetical protein ABW20_dc0106502 [Dactylellina cionopaga]|nr:hypothetical protein ABW20_dc0106502 [Dactylellina cionopaga]